MKDLLVVLNLPWTQDLVVSEPSHLWKTKIYSIQVLSKLGPLLTDEDDLRVLDLCLHDESEDVVAEAIMSMPVIVYFTRFVAMASMLRRIE